MTTDRLLDSSTPSSYSPPKWVRADDGVLFGVCTALARRLDVAPWIVRAVWLLTVLFFGTGLLAYFVLAATLPRESDYATAQDGRILGVCADLARRTGEEVGLIRLLAVIFAIGSMGATIVAYLVLYVVMDQRNSQPA
jgi:phage shock protein PspC (stress-responsive transcriptional regulator)